MTREAVNILVSGIPNGTAVDVFTLADKDKYTSGKVYETYPDAMLLALEVDVHGSTRYKYIDLSTCTRIDVM